MVGFIDKKDKWDKVFYPSDQNAFTTMRDTLKQFLADSKISGIILDLPTIYVSK